MKTEISALLRLNHPNILRILAAKTKFDYLDGNGMQQRCDYIATEFLPRGELYDFANSERGGFPEPVAKQLFLQMLAGLNYMHN